MEKDRSSKIISMIALAIAVVGMSVGFASFSNTLSITSEAAYTASDGILDVQFVGVTDGNPDHDVTTVTPTKFGDSVTKPVGGENAIIDNSNATGPTIKNLKASFSDKGQSVVYDFYVFNNSKYIAYRKIVMYNEIANNTNTKPNIKCIPTSSTLSDEANGYIARACESISVSVKVGSDVADKLVNTYSGKALLAKDDVSTDYDDRYEKVKVTISYDDDAINALDDFNVEIGDITILYSSSND